jgi:hypothetical protein
MHGLPWNRETTFNLGTNRDVLHILPQRVGEKTIQLVSSIITDVFPEQTGADPDSNFFHSQYLLTSKTRYEKRCSSFILWIFNAEPLLQILFFEKFDVD